MGGGAERTEGGAGSERTRGRGGTRFAVGGRWAVGGGRTVTSLDGRVHIEGAHGLGGEVLAESEGGRLRDERAALDVRQVELPRHLGQRREERYHVRRLRRIGGADRHLIGRQRREELDEALTHSADLARARHEHDALGTLAHEPRRGVEAETAQTSRDDVRAGLEGGLLGGCGRRGGEARDQRIGPSEDELRVIEGGGRQQLFGRSV